MDSSTLLDYALFQLTPTRTRCDLILFRGGNTEKLASGLFQPFVSHLEFVKDQISKGGYSIKLCPHTTNASWFTKGTFERFVRFVSTPAVLERFVSLEKEILQIEGSVHANELSNHNMVGQPEEGNGSATNVNIRKSNDSSKLKDEIEKRDDAVPEENSKLQLQRLLETRKALLRKEQAMAFARGLVAGFEVHNIADLICFADAFGASRLREACINFKELCKKKRGDGLWMEELAAMEACPPTELSFLGASGIVLTNEIGTFTQNITPNGSLDASRSDSTASHASSDNKKDDNLATSDQMPSTPAKVQVPTPWPNNIPQYVYNFQSPVQQMTPYPGYPFPTMQSIPHYPMNMQWLPSMKESGRMKKEKFQKKKALEGSGEDEEIESSNSEAGSNSDSYIQQDKKHSSVDASSRKKHRKKSSKTVVIRNINYIASNKRNGEKDRVSDETSSDEDEFIDEDSLKQKVDDAVGSLEKLHESRSSRKRVSRRSKCVANGLENDPAQDSDNGLVSNASDAQKTNANWDAFQNLLMKDEENGAERLGPLDVRDEHFTIRNSGDGISLNNPVMDIESEKVLKQRMAAGDSFIVNQRDGGLEDRLGLEEFQNTESSRAMIKKTDSADEDLVISCRMEEPESGLPGVFSSCADEASRIKPGRGEDWFVINHSGKPEANEQTIIFSGDCTLPLRGDCSITENRKDILIDDSFMVHTRPAVDDLSDSQWKTDISMGGDLSLSSQLMNDTVQDNRVDNYEPDDLCMVLERDSGIESARESWNTDQGIDISFMEADRRNSGVETKDADKKLPSDCDSTIAKKNETNGRKVPAKGVRSKVLNGSLGKSRTEMMSKTKKTPPISRPKVQKSKLEKEEEIRKKMEQLAIERQKRIAERTAAAGLALTGAKKVPSENKTLKSSIKTDRNRTHSTIRETNKISSVKIRAA